jgi:hypothetical protein
MDAEITNKLRELFQLSDGSWRQDGHIGVNWLHETFHEKANALHREDLKGSRVAAIECSALLKLHTHLSELLGSSSAQLLADSKRILSLFHAYAAADVSLDKNQLTNTEKHSAGSILEGLSGLFAKQPKEVRGRYFGPTIGPIAMQPRRPGITRRAGVLGVSGKLFDLPNEELTNQFILAHSS